jgi:sodium transport system permease protein
MNLRHVWTVFRKDGQELLRDRRTLFVNVVLPVLLYPLMFMFLLQVWQLTAAQKPPPPRVALLGVDGRIAELLAAPAAAGSAALPVALTVPDPPLAADLTRLALAVQAAVAEKDEADGVRERRRAAYAALLARMRADDARLAYVVVDRTTPEERAAGRRSIIAAKDDAHPDYDQARDALSRAFQRYGRELAEAAADRIGLDRRALEPLAVTAVELAPGAQAARSRLAGIIPLLLVVMAVGGAFHPALDLIAGERERGTLETLLSWPVSRRDLFLGKLLVTIFAGVVAVVLNLASLGATAALAGSQFAGAAAAGGADMRELLSVGAGTLALSFVALLPLIVTLAAVSLALAGFAASSKEAQNYLSPLFLVVFMAAAVAQVPGARPNLALDLIPITGPVLALKECLRASSLPWLHLGLSTAASIALAAVVVAWSVRLLDQESFCYPGLVRAGWGRFRRWGAAAAAPGGLEVIGLFAVCAAGFLYGGAHLARFGPVAQVVGPLLLFVALPALLYGWLGGFRPAALHLMRPQGGDVLRGVAIAPLALVLSLAIFSLQPAKADDAGAAQMGQLFALIQAQGGLPLVLLCIAIAPGICEELLFRGPLLAGLRTGLGPVGAVLVSAFLFAVFHLDPYRFLPQFGVGVVLAVLTLRSGSLVPGMIVHALHNAGAVLLGDWLGEDGRPLGRVQALGIAGAAAVLMVVILRRRRGSAAA